MIELFWILWLGRNKGLILLNLFCRIKCCTIYAFMCIFHVKLWNDNYVYTKEITMLTGTLTTWYERQMQHAMVWLLEFSLGAWKLPTPWWGHWRLGQYGLIASVCLMLRYLSVVIRWALWEGKRVSTALTITCKWRLTVVSTLKNPAWL